METGHVQWEVLLGDRIESSACLSMHGAYIVVGMTLSFIMMYAK